MYRNLMSIEKKPRVTRADVTELIRITIDRPKRPLTKAKFTMIRHSHQLFDFFQLTRLSNAIVYALIIESIIEDDSWSVLGRWNIDQRYRPKSEGELIEVFVQELPDKRN